MKIGVYVGSFNPVHIGHIKIVKHLIDNNYFDKVIIIPTGNYWNKQNLTNITHRINMLKLYENGSIKIDTTLNNLTYTYQIFEKLSKNSNDDFGLIIGADNIVNFDKWKNYEYLLNFELLIINRGSIDVKFYLKKHNIKKYRLVEDFPLLEVSSSMIRNLVENEEYIELKKYVDANVLEYIKANSLYKRK